MNAVGGIFVALSLVFGGGYALRKIYVATKVAAVERTQKGMPHLSDFSNRLTCSKISAAGTLVEMKSAKLGDLRDRNLVTKNNPRTADKPR